PEGPAQGHGPHMVHVDPVLGQLGPAAAADALLGPPLAEEPLLEVVEVVRRAPRRRPGPGPRSRGPDEAPTARSERAHRPRWPVSWAPAPLEGVEAGGDEVARASMLRGAEAGVRPRGAPLSAAGAGAARYPPAPVGGYLLRPGSVPGWRRPLPQ